MPKKSAKREGDGVPIGYRVDPTGRVGKILSGPEGQERGDDEALKADDQEELTTTTAAVEGFDFIGVRLRS